MIRASRIAKARHAAQAFSGAGSLSSGGRWHHKGERVVYAASSLALAALEVFVHLERAQNDIRWVASEISIPDTVPMTTLAARQLPRDWRREPPAVATMRIGSAWLRQAGSAVLRVPSAIVPAESNYILNPAHPEFHKIRIAPPTPFSFDSRMWK